MSAPKKNLLASFVESHALLDATSELKRERFDIVNVYMPFPDHHLLEGLTNQKSPVKYLTFWGAGLGLVSGLGLALYTSSIWEIIVTGKPVYSIVPFIVVGFELLILLGALFTFFAILFFGRLPYRRFPPAAYRTEFSDDHFGLWVSCPAERVSDARQILSRFGAAHVDEVIGKPLKDKEARA